MIRHAIAVVVAIVLMPIAASAQTKLTIETSSTDVHESPAIDARVIGEARRGHVLDVAHEDGEWVTVVWPEAASHVGYVRLRVGSLDDADRTDESPVSDVRADVEAVERAVWAIWEARFHHTNALLDDDRR